MKICCSKCSGSGMVELPEYLAQTLEVVELSPGAETGQIHAALVTGYAMKSANVSTVNMRLNALMELMLVQRIGNGSRYNPYRWFPRRPK